MPGRASFSRERPCRPLGSATRARVGDAVAGPLSPGSLAPSASPGLVLPGLSPPTASLVQHALFGLEQRLLQPAQGHRVQRLETAPAELPVGRVAGRLPWNHPPSYDPARMLDFKPGKAGGWSTAHSVPPDSGSAVPGHRTTPARKAPRLPGWPGGSVPAGRRSRPHRTVSKHRAQWRGGCGAWRKHSPGGVASAGIVDESVRASSRRATGPTVARRTAAAAPREGR
jgi:hypothetical protein